MELKQYLSIIYKRLWIIVLFSIIAIGVSAYISLYILKPVYEANTTLFVNNKNIDSQLPIAYNDVMVGQMLVKDYSELIKSRTVTQSVIDELNLKGVNPSDLAGEISVNSKNDTRIIQIKVRNGDPKIASSIANQLSNAFIIKVTELMKVDNVGIVDIAETPNSPVKPNVKINIVISFFVGIMASLGMIFLLNYFDDTIKTIDDVEKYLGLTVIGTIPTLNIA